MGLGAAAVVLVCALVAIGLQTGPGRLVLSRLASNLLSGAMGQTVRVEAISGIFPIDFTLGRLAMADEHGVWLAVKDLHLAWSPLALLRGRVLVRAVTADIIRLRRIPQSPAPPPEPVPMTWPPQFPSLPPILVDTLAVNRCILDAPVAGQDAVLRLAGRLAESGQGALGLHFRLDRLDGRPMQVNVAGALNYADWHLSLLLGLHDAAGGLLASALAGPNGGPLAVNLTGDGPLTAWKAKLSATIADQSVLDATLGLTVPLAADTASWSANADVHPPQGVLPLWDEHVARFTGGPVRLDIAGRSGIVSGAFALDRANIGTATGQLVATASLDPKADTLAAKVTITVPDASRLAPDLAGALETTLTAAGPVAKPELTVETKVTGLRTGTVSLEGARLTAKAVLAGKLHDTFPGATVTATGRLTGLAGPQGTTLLGQNLDLALSTAIAPDGAVAAKDCRVTGQGGSLAASADLGADGTLSANLEATVKELSGLASLGGLSLTGQATTKAAVKRNAAGQGQASVNLRLNQLATTASTGASAAVTALLGPTPSLDAALTMDQAGPRLSRLSLDGKALRLTGSGGLETGSQRVTSQVKAELPDLRGLGPALGWNLAGGCTLEASLSGPADNPEARVTLQGRGLVLDAAQLDGLTLEATARDLIRRPAGRLRLTARRDKETLELATEAAMEGQTVNIPSLRLTAPDTNLEGQLRLDTAKGLVTGRVNGAASDLSAVGRFAGLPLAGSLKLAVTAATGRNGQTIAADIAVSDLHATGLSAKTLHVTANLDELSSLPRGKARLTAKGLATGDLDLASLDLEATGDGKRLDLTAETQGTLPGGRPLTLRTQARLAGSAKERTITVSRLSGSLAKRDFTLQGPTTVVLAGSTTRLDGLALTCDKAKLTASGSLGPRAVEGKVSLAQVPLPLLALAGITGIDGSAGATINLSGSPAQPRLAAEAHIEGLKLATTKGRTLAPMTVKASADLEAGKLTAKTSLAGAGKKELVVATVSLPVRFSLAPTTFVLPPAGALSGRITANGDLSDVAGLLAQANTRLVGHIAADLALSGTLAAPDVTGSAQITASRLENADSGLVLRDLTLRVEASGGTITLTQAAASDLKGGTLNLTGSVGPLTATDAPVALTAKLHHLKVAGLDLVSATADGTVAVTGTLAHLKVGGALIIGPAEINLPTSLPPSVVVIPVTVVNDPAAKPAKPKSGPPAAARRVDIDYTVSLGQSVYIRGMGLESRWGGSVAITGTGDDPRGKGKFTAERGTVELFGGNLNITKGEVRYDGQSLLAPRINILASNTSDDTTVGVSLTGDAANPTIALFSQPTLPDNEILARILFGQSANALSPLQAAQLAQAGASLYTGGGPTSILARTRRILGLDQLNLVSGASSGSPTAILRAGKEIFKGVTVNAEQGTEAQSGAVSVEVKITPNITVESRVGDDNKQGVGVNWKWDY
jgi:translocation and assembly module TamB